MSVHLLNAVVRPSGTGGAAVVPLKQKLDVTKSPIPANHRALMCRVQSEGMDIASLLEPGVLGVISELCLCHRSPGEGREEAKWFLLELGTSAAS